MKLDEYTTQSHRSVVDKRDGRTVYAADSKYRKLDKDILVLEAENSLSAQAQWYALFPPVLAAFRIDDGLRSLNSLFMEEKPHLTNYSHFNSEKIQCTSYLTSVYYLTSTGTMIFQFRWGCFL